MIIDGAGPERIGDDRQTRSMVEQVAHRQLLLAVLRKLGPVFCHGRIDVHEPSIHQQAKRKSGDALGH